MLKINAGRSEERNATLLGFGLEEGNLVKLQEGKPICIQGSEMCVRGSGFVFYYAKDKEAVPEALNEILEPLKLPETTEVPVLHMVETFYLTTLAANGQHLYIVGLDESSYKALRSGKSLTYRARTNDEKCENVQSEIFWGKDADHLKERWEGIR